MNKNKAKKQADIVYNIFKYFLLPDCLQCDSFPKQIPESRSLNKKGIILPEAETYELK